MNDFVPVLQVAQFFFAVAQHPLKGPVGKGPTTCDAEKTDPDLGIVEYGAEELLVRPQAFLAGLAHRFSSYWCGLHNDATLEPDFPLLAKMPVF
jgi:hypothetical protein